MSGCGLALAHQNLARIYYLPYRLSGNVENWDSVSDFLQSVASFQKRRRQIHASCFINVVIKGKLIEEGIGSYRELTYYVGNNGNCFFIKLIAHSARPVRSTP